MIVVYKTIICKNFASYLYACSTPPRSWTNTWSETQLGEQLTATGCLAFFHTPRGSCYRCQLLYWQWLLFCIPPPCARLVVPVPYTDIQDPVSSDFSHRQTTRLVVVLLYIWAGAHTIRDNCILSLHFTNILQRTDLLGDH